MPKIKETCLDEEILLKEIKGLAWAGILSSRDGACDAAEAACSAIFDRILAWDESCARQEKGETGIGTHKKEVVNDL